MRKKILVNTSRLTTSHFLIVLLGILLGIQVIVSNQIATSGKVLSELEKRSISLEEENRQLLSENVDYMSLRELSEKAKLMGYVEPEKIINVVTGNKDLALR